MTTTPKGVPEEHVGPVILDPWDDPDQTDWPNNTLEEVKRGGGVLGPDEGADELPEQA